MLRSLGLVIALVLALSACADAAPSSPGFARPVAPSPPAPATALASSQPPGASVPPSAAVIETAPPASARPTAAPSTQPTPGVTAPTASAAGAATPRPARWAKAGRFASPRLHTQLAVLGSGEVLAAGSEMLCGIENSATASAELWRRSTQQWRRTSRQPGARTMTTLIPLADGRAMVTGGATADYVAKSGTIIYSPRTHRWSTSGLLHSARMSFAWAPLADGGALVAGGLLIRKDQTGHALRTAERWNPKTGRWAVVAPLSSVRMGATAVTLSDGRVLVVGGWPSWGADAPVATAEIYDPETGRWQPAGALPAARSGFTLLALRGGGALVLGGEAGERDAVRFDAGTGEWSAVEGTLPAGPRPAAVLLADGRVLVVAGRTAVLYDEATGRWRTTPGLPGGMWDAQAVRLRDGSVLVAGGWNVPPAPGDTPGCEGYGNRSWRYIPGS